MKFKIKHAVVIAVNVIALTAIGILTVIGSSSAKSQQYNYTADRWKNDSKENFAQVSTFFTDDSGFNTDSLNAVRAGIIKELQNASFETENGRLPFSDAYSASMGTVTVKGDLTGRTDADLTATGGDFFLFRNFELVNGSFFSENDLMQDGAVIDRSIAWSLYGSYEVSGMNIYINGVKFYISGVIENPDTKPEKHCAGKLPKIYISYDGASSLSMLSADSSNPESTYAEFSDNSAVTGFRNITCYETVIPDPVENFAYNAVKTQFSESYKDKCSIVKNSVRFSPSARVKAFKKISDYAVVKKSINYPYWENASRLVEFKLSFIYFFRRLLFTFPVLTLLWLAVLAIKFLKKKKPVVLRAVSIFIDRRRRDIKEKLKNRQKKA
ncbi:MAG: ABC transporter permease [Ruminococcus sp.]|nr:ABC transporter permease [Ruminococcus sp.]